jgi:hypothetical protein
LGRAHSAAYKELHAKVSADRGVAVNLLNASAWSFAYAPVTKVVMPTGLTKTEKRTRLRSLSGVTVAIQPLRPIPKTAPAVRAWYNQTSNHVRADERPFFTAVRWSRTGALLADSLRRPTVGEYNVAMGNGRPTNDNTELCYECLLPWIPQLCELDVLEDWGRVHQLHFPSKGGKSRHTTTHNGIQIDCIEDYVVRALGTAQRPFLRRPLMWEVVANHGSVDPEPFKRLHPSLEPALSPLT